MSVCTVVVAIFAALYLLALAVLAASVRGWFGIDRDPLSGIFLVLLGLPWNRLLDRFPGASRAVLTALAPAVNLLILVGLCRVRR